MPNVRGPYFSIWPRKPWATLPSASSHVAARCPWPSRISGCVRRTFDGVVMLVRITQLRTGNRLEICPDPLHLEDESGDRSFAFEPVRLDDGRRRFSGAIDVGGAVVRVEQPSWLDAILDPLAHLRLNALELV